MLKKLALLLFTSAVLVMPVASAAQASASACYLTIAGAICGPGK